MDKMAVKLKLKDVVATVAMKDEVRCIERVNEVVMTTLLPTSMPSAAARGTQTSQGAKWWQRSATPRS